MGNSSCHTFLFLTRFYLLSVLETWEGILYFFIGLRKTSLAGSIGKNVFLTFSRYLLGGPWQGHVITGLGAHLNQERF